MLTAPVLVVLFAFCAVIANAASVETVRVAASPSVVQMRIEVRSDGGTVLYESPWRDGNLLDWSAGTLAYGSYSVRIFTKDLEGPVMYQFLGPMLLNEVQKEHRRNEEQQKTIETLNATVASLGQRLQVLERLLANSR